jgi:DNA repair photolyase
LLRTDGWKIDKEKEILLCFYCDPYPVEGDEITREALLVLESHKAKVSILTKNGMRATRDFDILERNGWKFGCTIACNEKTRRETEPNAESIYNRFTALQRARSMGIYTWVSVEPIFKPLEALAIISMLKGRVDEFKIGKINYHSELEKAVDWHSLLITLEELLKGEKYSIKKALMDAACLIKTKGKKKNGKK